MGVGNYLEFKRLNSWIGSKPSSEAQVQHIIVAQLKRKPFASPNGHIYLQRSNVGQENLFLFADDMKIQRTDNENQLYKITVK